jgi:LacI family transcriptional regulator
MPPSPPTKRLTLAMMADRLGLSTATVSLALRGSPLVAAETRRKVQDLADALGYIYNRSAASLRTARSDIVGVVVHDVLNAYFAELLSTLEAELTQRGLTVILCNHGDDHARQRRFLETLLQHRSDGVILCPSVGTQARDIARIEEAGLPTVLVAREVPEAEGTPMIRGDDAVGMERVVGHLIASGHRRIAFVGGSDRSSSGRERRRGFEAAMAAAGLAVDADLVFSDQMTRAEGRKVAAEVIRRRPTAIACFNDLIAFGLMMEMNRLGLAPGRDIAVSGYDDVEEAAIWSPSLTSVWNGQQEVGRRAALMLTELIAGRAPAETRVLVTPELRVRETTTGGAPRETSQPEADLKAVAPGPDAP